MFSKQAARFRQLTKNINFVIQNDKTVFQYLVSEITKLIKCKLESGKKKAPCQSWCVHGICNIDLQYNTIQYNTIQYNTIQYNTIQYNTI